MIDRDVRPHPRPHGDPPASATGFSATRPVATIAICGPETTGAKKSTG